MWRRNPPEITEYEHYRRRFKKFFGYKPCGLSMDELERIVLQKEEEATWHRSQPLMDPTSRATLGDALKK